MATIRELRLARGMSQQDLATHAHITQHTLSNMENGRDVYRGTLVMVCQALGVSPDEVEGVNLKGMKKRTA